MSPSSVASSPSQTSSRVQTLALAFCLALGPAVGIGFGRFAYALVLPAMKTDMNWTFGQAGMMGTANALGYLLGALLTAPLLRFTATRSLLLLGMGVSVAALGGAAATHSFGGLLFFRALVGLGAAPAFICATGLAAYLGKNAEENALAMGLTICGGGIGTILSGAIVPTVLDGDPSHWPRAWGAMAALGLAGLVVVALTSRGITGEAPPRSQAQEAQSESGHDLGFAYFSYFLFGLGYIAYMTFLVVYMRGLHASGATVALVWASLGAAIIASSWVWKAHLAQNRGGQTMTLMAVGGAVCALLPLWSTSVPMLLASAIGFGATTMPVVTAITVLIRRHLPTPEWNGAIASVTSLFALGQSLGPVAAGQLSDRFGASASLWWSAAVLILAALVALGQKAKQEFEL